MCHVLIKICGRLGLSNNFSNRYSLILMALWYKLCDDTVKNQSKRASDFAKIPPQKPAKEVMGRRNIKPRLFFIAYLTFFFLSTLLSLAKNVLPPQHIIHHC